MNNMEIQRSIAKKLSMYHGEPEQQEQEVKASKYSSYAEAKEKGDVKAMLAYKRATRTTKGAELRRLSAEYCKLPISEIQSKLRASELTLEKAKGIVEQMQEQEYNRLKKEYSRIGGLVGIRLEGAIAEAMQDYTRTDTAYLEALADYNSCKAEKTALKNAKDNYILTMQDMIEEERIKAQREELRSSGILAELGIVKQEE